MEIDELSLSKNKSKTWSDFDIDLMKHPKTGDVAAIYDEASIRNSLVNLVNTKKGDVPFQPWIGSDVHKILFDNMSSSSSLMLKYKIEDVINNFEPRVNLHNIKVTPDYGNNAYEVQIGFSIINVNDKQSLSLQLSRVR